MQLFHRDLISSRDRISMPHSHHQWHLSTNLRHRSRFTFQLERHGWICGFAGSARASATCAGRIWVRRRKPSPVLPCSALPLPLPLASSWAAFDRRGDAALAALPQRSQSLATAVHRAARHLSTRSLATCASLSLPPCPPHLRLPCPPPSAGVHPSPCHFIN